MVFSQAQLQIGSPPTLSADAALGYSLKGNQSAVMARTKCDAGKNSLVRLEGPVAKAQAATKEALA